MQTGARFEVKLLPGAKTLLEQHALELPQRDDLCGAFCAALALRAGGIDAHAGEPLDQDAVALAAGTVISTSSDGHALPAGESGRRDYRLSLPAIEDSAVSGTPATGLPRAIEELSAGSMLAIPYSGPWNAATLHGIFDFSYRLPRPVTLIANVATHHLWGARSTPAQLLGYLLDGEASGPPPDWDVGHFVCVAGRVDGPAGSLYCVADTYPSLGSRGVHLQPEERLALAIARPDKPAGGVLVVAAAQDAPAVRAAAVGLGLEESLWDNGTPVAGTLT
jgi:hypothetical protein